MGHHQIEDLLLHVRPDGGALRVGGGGTRQIAGGVADRRQVGDGHHHVQLPALLAGWGHDVDRTSAGQEPADLLDRTDGRRQPDPLRGLRQQGVQSFQAEREVGAALGAGHGVHLVQDDGLDAPQRFPCGRGEQQEERFRRGDQDVGRVPGEGTALLGRGVARPDAHPDLRTRQPQPGRGMADAHQGRPQVALDVHRQGLERRDVEDAAAPLRIGSARVGNPGSSPGRRGWVSQLRPRRWGEAQPV